MLNSKENWLEAVNFYTKSELICTFFRIPSANLRKRLRGGLSP